MPEHIEAPLEESTDEANQDISHECIYRSAWDFAKSASDEDWIAVLEFVRQLGLKRSEGKPYCAHVWYDKHACETTPSEIHSCCLAPFHRQGHLCGCGSGSRKRDD